MPNTMEERSNLYKTMFSDYPDVVTVKQMCKMIGGIGEKTAYRLIRSGAVKHIVIGHSIRIPKVFLIDYLMGAE